MQSFYRLYGLLALFLDLDSFLFIFAGLLKDKMAESGRNRHLL